MPPPVPIFAKKMDDKQVIYFMWPNLKARKGQPYYKRVVSHVR